MRLDKYIVNCGKATRSEVKKLIKAGKITVNGAMAKKSDMQIDENTDKVEFDKEMLHYREFVYLMLNKPAGYVSATYDKKLPVVVDLVPEEYTHFNVFPVGRLDIDTEGLLILTNDGKFAHDVTAPKKHVYKTYYAKLDKEAEEADISVFHSGMDLGDFVAQSAVLEISGYDASKTRVKVYEGKFHQVKRMFEQVGKTVVYLKRLQIGGLCLDAALKTGELRELTAQELELLKEKGL